MQEASSKTRNLIDRETDEIPRLIMLLFVGAFVAGAVVGYFTQGFGFFGRADSTLSPSVSRPASPSKPPAQTSPLPQPKPIAVPAPVRPPAPLQATSPDYGPVPPQARTRVEPPRTVQAVNVSGPVFRIQVGAFRSRENAETLVQRLQQNGFQPYINYAAGMHRVRIGPFSERAEADRMVAELKAKNYDVFVTR